MYYTKKFYAPMLISPHVDDDGNLNIYVVSDSPEAKQAQMVLSLIDLNVRTAIRQYGMSVVGVENSFEGLLDDKMIRQCRVKY